MPPKPAPVRNAKSEFVEKYGIAWSRQDANDLNVELACYARPKEFPTGQTKEFHFRNAWKIVWPKWEWNEWAELMVWAWCNYRIEAVIGHTSSGKSYTTAHCAMLDYIALPLSTSTTFTTTKFDSLRTRIWGDLMHAIESSALRDSLLAVFKPTTTSNELKFGLRDRAQVDSDRFMIQGVATDSADTTASKIRGQHTDRRRIIGDECEDMGEAIYTAIANARVAPDFRAVLLTNPALKMSLFGSKWACPKNGWGSVNENETFWETVQPDGICLHFDGLQSPNLKARHTVFPYLLDQKYVDDIKATEGENSPKWWMFVRGFPAPDGVVGLVWAANTVEKAMAAQAFDYPPTPCASLDPAFDYDDCVLTLGELGRLRSGKMCVVVKQSVKIKTASGPKEIPKDYQIAREVMRLCREAGVPPENYIQDETGNGRGVLAILRMEWSPRCQGVSYGGEATDRPLRLNDNKKASEQVRYFVTELWFRASYLAQDGMMCGLANLDRKAIDDISGRRYELKQHGDRKVMLMESKEKYKERLGRSPDYGDSLCQLAELMVRKGLIGESSQGLSKIIWKRGRELARSAAKRFIEEYTHGNTSLS